MLAVTVSYVASLPYAGQARAPATFSPEQVPGAADTVRAAVAARLTEWDPDTDPLINLSGGAQAKSSNVLGVEVDGTRYFYRSLHHASFDPLSRGQAGDYVTVAVLHPGTEWEVEIYRRR
jgi:hypothetical protein